MKYVTRIILIFLILNIGLKAADFPKIEGWKKTSDVLQFHPGNLWEHINGAADQFLDYGFEELLTTELSSKTILVSVEIYNMGLPLNAFGIYLTERPEESNPVRIGTEAIISLPAQCLLFKDRYYVKVHLFEGELTEDIGQNLLKAIANSLPGINDWPKELKLLPETGQIERSFGHVRKNYLGLNELSNCVFANYLEADNQKYQYFIIVPELNNSAENIWSTIKSKWKSTEVAQHTVLFRKVPYKGFVGIVQKGQQIIGVANTPDEEMLKTRISQLFN